MALESVSKEEYGETYASVVLEQWKTCVEMANSNTEKRTNLITFSSQSMQRY